MIKVFLDASVLFSGSYSVKGASREIIRRGIRSELTILVSEHVLEEAERNLEEKAPRALEAYRELLVALSPKVASKPSLAAVEEAASYIGPKGAPIIPVAIEAGVDYLVTLDRQHFIRDPEVTEKSGLNILTPGELIAILKGE